MRYHNIPNWLLSKTEMEGSSEFFGGFYVFSSWIIAVISVFNGPTDMTPSFTKLKQGEIKFLVGTVFKNWEDFVPQS